MAQYSSTGRRYYKPSLIERGAVAPTGKPSVKDITKELRKKLENISSDYEKLKESHQDLVDSHGELLISHQKLISDLEELKKKYEELSEKIDNHIHDYDTPYSRSSDEE